MKAKDKIKKETISFARAAIKQYEIDNKVELDDQGVINILSKQVKMKKMPSLVLRKQDERIYMKSITRK